MPFGNRKKYFRGSFQFSEVTLKKYHPSGNLKINNFGIFQRLKLRIIEEKVLPISLKLNFTPNTLGCYALNGAVGSMETPFIKIHQPPQKNVLQHNVGTSWQTF